MERAHIMANVLSAFPPVMLFLYKPWCLILLFVQQLCPNRSKLAVRRKEVTMQSMRNKKHNLFIFKPSARVGLIRSKKFFTGQNFSSTNPKIPVYNFQSQHFWHSEVWICVGSLGSFLWLFCDLVETVKLGFPGNLSKPTTDISFSSFFLLSEVCTLQMEGVLISF